VKIDNIAPEITPPCSTYFILFYEKLSHILHAGVGLLVNKTTVNQWRRSEFKSGGHISGAKRRKHFLLPYPPTFL